MVLAPLVVLVPIIAATALAAISPFARRVGGPVGIAAALGATTLAALVLGSSSERGVTWLSGWHPRGAVAIGIDFAPGRLGAGLALFVAALAVVALIASTRLIAVKTIAFDALVLIFVAAMLGFAYSGDLFNLFVFFELMSVTAYVLVGYEVGRRTALEGSLTFAVTNTVGSFLFLFGIGLLYGRSGALNLAQIGRALQHGPVDAAVVVAFALIACGLLVKAAVVPFHLWTADAYAVAPTPICILLAGAFSELGLFGLFRIYWTAFHGVLGPHEDALRVVLVTAGALTGLLGAVMCTLQHHLKRMLAFATIAQVGLFLLGLALLTSDGVAGAAVWVVGDGLVKAALFVIVAIVQHRYDRVTEGGLHARAREMWPLGALFALGALMIASLPPTGSFLGRSLVEDAALKEHGYAWVPALMAVVTAVVAGTLLRAAARVFAGWGVPAGDDPLAGEDDDEAEDERDAPAPGRRVLWVLSALLLVAAAAWGLVPGLIDAAARAAAEFTGSEAYAAAVLDGVHRAVEVPELKSPSATGYLYAAASVAGALAVAAAALAGLGSRMPRGVVAARRRLRGVHDGRPADYVAWLTAGAAVLCGCLAIVLQ